MGQKRNSKIFSFQGLRTLAFLCIFLSHTDIVFLASSDLGAWGVSVFLMLSGFLMLINYYKKDRITSISLISNFKFSLKKLSKLYSLHILLMLTALPFAIRTLQRDNHIIGYGSSILKIVVKMFFNITLTQSFIPHSAIFYSLNAVAWYLSVCLFLYFSFPYILHFFETRMCRHKAIFLIGFMFMLQIILCFVSSKVAISFSDNFTKWFVYIFPVMRLIEFIIGSALGYLFLLTINGGTRDTDHQPVKKRNWGGLLTDTCLIISLSSIFIMLFITPPKFLWYRLTCRYTMVNSLLIYCLACNEGDSSSIIRKIFSFEYFVWLGNLSGNMFLIHQMVIRYLNVFANIATLQGGIILQISKVFIALLMTITTALLLNKIAQKKYVKTK